MLYMLTLPSLIGFAPSFMAVPNRRWPTLSPTIYIHIYIHTYIYIWHNSSAAESESGPLSLG